MVTKVNDRRGKYGSKADRLIEYLIGSKQEGDLTRRNNPGSEQTRMTCS